MKIYTKEIPTCFSCPLKRDSTQGSDYHCLQTTNPIYFPFDIPSWCPLPDKTDKKERKK